MSKARLTIIFFIFFIFGALILSRLFSIQVTQTIAYQAKAQRQQTNETQFQRGNIWGQDRSGSLFLLATTKTFLRLYAIPSKIPVDKEQEVATLLSKELAIPAQILQERLSRKDDPYEPLKEGISPEQKEHFQSLASLFPDGLKLQEYKDRFYPYGSLGAHLLGFVGFGNNRRVGVYGLEQYYENTLAKGDADLVTSIDTNVQKAIEESLHDLVTQWKSPSGSIIAMRPKDGAILGMASWPTFDPNHYKDASDVSYFLNPVVQNVFEPGSIVKPVTMAAGLQSGKITPQTTYIDKGFIEKGGYTIRNAGGRVYGQRTMEQVLEFSINTGAIFVQELVGQKDFLQMFENFGFGRATGIDLPGELRGDITNLDTGRPINYATAAFGQGISTTPLQILCAIGAIANEGKLVTPHVVERILWQSGKKVSLTHEIRNAAISPDIAARLVAMLTDVVQNGYDKKARVAGYAVAGKTGTSQIPDPKGGYEEKTIHSFIGFAPSFDPAFILVIKLDEPIGKRFASESIAPTFAKLTQYLLQYYGILPDKGVEQSRS